MDKILIIIDSELWYVYGEFTKLFSLLWDIVEVFYNIKFFESVMEPAGRSIGPGVYLISRRSAGLVRGSWMKAGCRSLWNLLMVGVGTRR